MALVIGTGWTMVNDSDAADRAFAYARGEYQRNLLRGLESLSGSTLRGRAKSYGGRYAASRANLLRRIRAAGIPVGETTGWRGRRILVLG